MVQKRGDIIIKPDLKHKYIAIGTLFVSIALALYFRQQSIIRLATSNLFIGSNSYYHLRNIQYIIANFPNTLGFDAYTQYPKGIVQPLIPLYDFILASIAWCLGLGHPTTELIYNICLYMPSICAIIIIIFTFFIADKLFDNVAIGAIAALLLSVMPGMFLIKSIAGYNDDAIFEVMLCSVVIYALVCSFKWLQYENIINGEENPEKESSYTHALVYSVLAGAIFSALTFDGSLGLIFIPILLLYFAARNIMDYANRINIEHQLICSIAFFVVATAFSFLLYTIFQKLNATVDDFSADYLIVCVIVMCVIGLLTQLFDRYDVNKRFSFYIMAPIVIGIVVYANYNLPHLINLFPHIMEPVTSSDMKSIFAIDDDLYSANFAICGYLALLSLGILYINKLSGTSLFVFLWSIGILGAAMFQSRFGIFYAVNVAILSSYGLVKLWHFMKQKVTTPSALSAVLVLIYIVSGIVFYVNASTATEDMNSVIAVNNSSYILSDQWVDALHWLSNNTDDPHINMNYELNPPIVYPSTAYGILSSNVSGNYIQVIGNRLPIASPYENESNISSGFFASQNESYAVNVLETSNATIKYIVTDIDMTTSNFREATSMTPKDYSYIVIIPNATKNRTHIGWDNSSISLLHPLYYNTTLLRLHVFDGNGLNHFRLIYESISTNDKRESAIKDMYNKQFNKSISNTSSGDVKVFEYIKGAQLVGKTRPNKQVSLFTDIKTNQNRIFNYTQVTASNANGNYSFIIPYASTYTVVIGDTRNLISVNNTEVVNGLENYI